MADTLTRSPDPDRDTSSSGPAIVVSPQLAAVVLVAGLVIVRAANSWSDAADTSAAAALVLIVAGAVVLGCAALSAGAHSAMNQRLIDGVLLLAAAAVVVVEQSGRLGARHRSYPSDEGRLVQHAIAAVSHGRNPYARLYPDVAHFAGNTPLFGGGQAERFGYTPLSAEVGALLGHIWGRLGNAGVVGMLGLLATALIGVLVLPPVWRTLSIGVVLGLTPLTAYAINGHPVMLALPLICLACASWSRLGVDGRLGARGVLRAIALGLAAAAQQLTWLPAIGLLLALWLVRHARLGRGPASWLVIRFAAIAVAAFVIVDLPFMIDTPIGWLKGVLAEFAGPQAVAAGQGLVALSVSIRHGGGAFEFYSHATVLLLVGLLVVIVLGFRRLAAVVPLVLTLVFLVAIRSQAEYFLVFMPLWVVWAAGTDPAAIAEVKPLLRAPWRRLVAAAAVVPAAACLVVAVAVPAPLRLTLASSSLHNGRIDQLRILVDNRSGSRIVPHFYVDPSSHLRSPWKVVAGPRSVGAGARVMITLQPALLGPEDPVRGLRVWAIADAPQSMSSVAIARR